MLVGRPLPSHKEAAVHNLPRGQGPPSSQPTLATDSSYKQNLQVNKRNEVTLATMPVEVLFY